MTVSNPLSGAWLYHWSPSKRRKGIGRYGLVPGKKSVCGAWRPPYVAYALDPLSAWQMSGEIHPEIPEWDLWAVHSGAFRGVETILYDDRSIREVRVYEPAPGRELFFVGTRQQATGARGDD